MDGALTLPALREDLRLEPAGTRATGEPSWVIRDPVRNRFFRIGWLEVELLRRWHLRRADRVAAAVSRTTPIQATPEDAAAFAEFLRANELVRAHRPADATRLAQCAAARPRGRLHWLLHHYLFFRVPLARPSRFLQATLPWVRAVLSPPFLVLAVVVALAGSVLAGRQWDAFTAGVAATLTPAGLLGYLVALAFAKCIHEAGHAYAATRYGVRVAHMGVAFVVLWPMLYTDTGEAWKLANRWQRFRIAAAGMVAELVLAGFATLAWAISPDGAVRDACLFLATTSWVMTVAINASPFMRFDGYYLLCDAFDFPNLHERSFEQARAALRRLFAGLESRDAEPHPPAVRRTLVLFALCTWAYRFAVFLAIAVAVYLLFFKLLGIVLFAVEIGWFIVRPVWREAGVYWRRRREILWPRRAVACLALLLLLTVLFVPWRGQVLAPAWVHADPAHAVYSPVPARLSLPPRPGSTVAAGDVIARLESPVNEGLAALARTTSESARHELDRLAASRDGLERQAAVAEEWQRQLAALAAEREQIAQLDLRAPFAGQVVDTDAGVQAGTWVNPRQPLAVLVRPDSWVAEAFVPDAARSRLRLGAHARLRVRGEDGWLHAVVDAIDDHRVASLPHAALGASVALAGEPSKLAPKESLYRVRLRMQSPPRRVAVAFGTAALAADPASLAGAWCRHAWAVLVREGGF